MKAAILDEAKDFVRVLFLFARFAREYEKREHSSGSMGVSRTTPTEWPSTAEAASGTLTRMIGSINGFLLSRTIVGPENLNGVWAIALVVVVGVGKDF